MSSLPRKAGATSSPGRAMTLRTDSSSSSISMTRFRLRAVKQAPPRFTRLARSAAGEAGRLRCQDVEVDARGQRFALCVDVEDALRPSRSGRSTTICRSKRRGAAARVEDVGPVGGRHNDDALVGFEAVHLHEQLVEGLLALVVTAAHAGAAMATDGVDLVDEDDAGLVLLGLIEEVADPAGADADEHLTKSEPEMLKNGHAGLPRDRSRKKSLTRAGRAEQQHALGDAGAQALEPLRFSRKSLISSSSSTASSTPATSLKVILGWSTAMRLARDLPKLITLLPPPCIWFIGR